MPELLPAATALHAAADKIGLSPVTSVRLKLVGAAFQVETYDPERAIELAWAMVELVEHGRRPALLDMPEPTFEVMSTVDRVVPLDPSDDTALPRELAPARDAGDLRPIAEPLAAVLARSAPPEPETPAPLPPEPVMPAEAPPPPASAGEPIPAGSPVAAERPAEPSAPASPADEAKAPKDVEREPPADLPPASAEAELPPIETSTSAAVASAAGPIDVECPADAPLYAQAAELSVRGKLPEEIADMLGCDVGSVRKHIGNARQRGLQLHDDRKRPSFASTVAKAKRLGLSVALREDGSAALHGSPATFGMLLAAIARTEAAL